jgi:hypothetical protein
MFLPCRTNRTRLRGLRCAFCLTVSVSFWRSVNGHSRAKPDLVSVLGLKIKLNRYDVASCKVQGARCKVQVARCKLQGASCKGQVARCKLQGASCKVQVARCKLQGASCKVQVARCKLQGAGCKVQVARCKLQGARCKVQGARCKVQGARCKVQGASCKVQVARCKVQVTWTKLQGVGIQPDIFLHHHPITPHCNIVFHTPRKRGVNDDVMCEKIFILGE